MAKLAKRCCFVFLVCAFVYCCRAPGSPTPARMESAYCKATLKTHIASAFEGSAAKEDVKKILDGSAEDRPGWLELLQLFSPSASMSGKSDVCVGPDGRLHTKDMGISSAWEGWFLLTLSQCMGETTLKQCSLFEHALKDYFMRAARLRGDPKTLEIDDWEWDQLPNLRVGEGSCWQLKSAAGWQQVAASVWYKVTGERELKVGDKVFDYLAGDITNKEEKQSEEGVENKEPVHVGDTDPLQAGTCKMGVLPAEEQDFDVKFF